VCLIAGASALTRSYMPLALRSLSQPRSPHRRPPSRTQPLSFALLHVRQKALRLEQASITNQKWYFSPNCMTRALPALRMRPKLLLVNVFVGFPRLTRFGKLKNSERNSSLCSP
jgi:hypothetical protein